MATPDWTRPDLKSRSRLALPIAAGALGVATFGLGMFAGHEPPSKIIVPVVAPVSISVPPAPVADVVVMPPPPAPVAAPEPPRPPPRPATPQLAPGCYFLTEGQTPGPMCSWEDGFPAISADGKLIATKFIPSDGGRGYFGVSVHFLDARTGRVVRDALILSVDEHDPADTPEKQDKLRMKVYERAAAVQRKLDAGKFRTLISLGGHDLNNENEIHPETTKIYAEFAGSVARIVDPSTNTEIGRYDFETGPPGPRSHRDEECGAWGMRRFDVWWDPATKTVAGVAFYQTGGCMCPGATVEEVFRLP